jgi:hypothetical protein
MWVSGGEGGAYFPPLHEPLDIAHDFVGADVPIMILVYLDPDREVSRRRRHSQNPVFNIYLPAACPVALPFGCRKSDIASSLGEFPQFYLREE